MTSREFFATDGRISIGPFVVDNKTGSARAHDAAGKSLRKFPNYDSARKAVSGAYNDAEAQKAARKRLEEPVGFVSGLPANFLGEKRR